MLQLLQHALLQSWYSNARNACFVFTWRCLLFLYSRKPAESPARCANFYEPTNCRSHSLQANANMSRCNAVLSARAYFSFQLIVLLNETVTVCCSNLYACQRGSMQLGSDLLFVQGGSSTRLHWAPVKVSFCVKPPWWGYKSSLCCWRQLTMLIRVS